MQQEQGKSLQSQIDDLVRRADAADKRADAADRRADASEALSAMDRQMIAELEADGQVRREHVEHLKTALKSSRTIGAAIGMIMASRNVDEDEAFTVLRKASQHANQKISVIAADLVASYGQSHAPGD